MRDRAKKESRNKKSRSLAERKRAKVRVMDTEIEDFNWETRLLKKLKQGKISQKKYDEMIDEQDKRLLRDLK